VRARFLFYARGVTLVETLDANEILRTARRLRDRIEERFPKAGLLDVASQLIELASHAHETATMIRRPNPRLRLLSYGGIALMVLATIVVAVAGLYGSGGGSTSWAERIEAADAAINLPILLGAAIYFVVHLETRVKRGRIVKALHQLRTLAHLIDVHQLTKSPEFATDLDHTPTTTKTSPERKLSSFELGRYLDYCSEMLSLTGKIAALYGDGFDDAESIEAVTEVEELTIGLQTKIWQKLILLRMTPARTNPSAPVQPAVVNEEESA
jgi:hypothetical protein